MLSLVFFHKKVIGIKSSTDSLMLAIFSSIMEIFCLNKFLALKHIFGFIKKERVVNMK